jgi:hypothetical protein
MLSSRPITELHGNAWVRVRLDVLGALPKNRRCVMGRCRNQDGIVQRATLFQRMYFDTLFGSTKTSRPEPDTHLKSRSERLLKIA